MNGGLRQPNCDLPKVSDIKSVADLASYPIESKLRFLFLEGCSKSELYFRTARRRALKHPDRPESNFTTI